MYYINLMINPWHFFVCTTNWHHQLGNPSLRSHSDASQIFFESPTKHVLWTSIIDPSLTLNKCNASSFTPVHSDIWGLTNCIVYMDFVSLLCSFNDHLAFIALGLFRNSLGFLDIQQWDSYAILNYLEHCTDNIREYLSRDFQDFYATGIIHQTFVLVDIPLSSLWCIIQIGEFIMILFFCYVD